MSVFYETYGASKNYTTPRLTKKHIRKFDSEVWQPSGLTTGMRCLEIGCGTGHFLNYLHTKGVTDLKAIDHDASLAAVIPAPVQDRFEAADVWAFIENDSDRKAYDRIFMFDVFEHFIPEDGLKLLSGLKARLNPGGAVILKMPNAGSPWGLQFQHGDLTHLAAYTPDSIRQMAVAAGMTCTSCWPHYLGSRSRQRLDKLLQAILDRIAATPPEIWEGNFYARIDKPG